jgi:alkanesulfonate monooxygenase SsuD/methylene tetrahydromethanopterin reductase-like flavin-dependent oxidoreductase (luciferase family)
VGVGWDVASTGHTGSNFPGLGERFDRLEEGLAICRALFQNEQATFTEKFYAVRDAYNSLRPVRGFIPVLVAGNGEKCTLDLAARYGDLCKVFGDPAEVRRRFEVLNRTASEPGETRRRSPGPWLSSPRITPRWPHRRGQWRSRARTG